MIGIIGALTIEIEKIRAGIENAKTETVSGVRYVSGVIAGRPVVTAVCGVGKVNAAVCTQTMIIKYAPEYIINTGVGGSLDSSLHICDVVVGESAVQYDFDTTDLGEPLGCIGVVEGPYFPLDETLSQKLTRAMNDLGVPSVKGVVATGDQFVGSPARKRAIAESFHARVCEMEGCAIAHACYLSNVPCAILRAISDEADDQAKLSFAEFAGKAANQSACVLKYFIEVYA